MDLEKLEAVKCWLQPTGKHSDCTYYRRLPYLAMDSSVWVVGYGLWAASPTFEVKVGTRLLMSKNIRPLLRLE
jgi:hypothetical protein